MAKTINCVEKVLHTSRKGSLRRAINKLAKRTSLRPSSPGSSNATEANSTHSHNEDTMTESENVSVANYNHSETYELSDMDNESLVFSKPPLPQSNAMTIFVGVFVAVGGFLFGYDTGLINSITDMKYVKSNLAPNRVEFTAKEMSILVSFLSLGTFFGALSAPLLSDSYGRKITIMFSTTIIFCIGNSLQVAANNVGLLIAGRVVSGIGIGLISAVVPLYQGEASHKLLRGAIISTYQWAITWGLLVSSAVSQGTHNRNSASSYRIPIGLQYVWAAVLAIGMFFLPESPRFYVLKDQLDKAAESLSFLRGVPITDAGLLEELVEIKATYDYEASFGSSSLLDCFRSSPSRTKQTLRMLSGIAIQACQQFSGINFIFYYGVNFFSRTGVTNSYMVSFITYAVNVAFNIPGLFLVETIGRRKVLLIGGILMTASNFIIAIVGCSTNSVIANKVMIAFICLFIASFSATWGGVVWVISAELYPLGIRSKCTAICAASNWLINFICALITPYIVDTGSHTSSIGTKIFFIWGSLNALGVAVVYFTIYETRGLTLEEIDELYNRSPNSMQSGEWNKRIRQQSINKFLNTADKIETEHSDDVQMTTTTNQSVTNVTVSNLHFDGAQTNFSSEKQKVDSRSNNATSMNTTYETSDDNDNDNKNNDNNNSNSIENDNTADGRTQGLSGNQQATCSETGYDEFTPNCVDLGNGLELNTYTRGPPSIPSDSSDEDNFEGDAEGRTFSHRGAGDAKHRASINEYMAHLMDSRTNSSNLK